MSIQSPRQSQALDRDPHREALKSSQKRGIRFRSAAVRYDWTLTSPKVFCVEHTENPSSELGGWRIDPSEAGGVAGGWFCLE